MQALWELINAASLAKLKPLIEPYAGGLLWDPVTVSILAAPAWSLLGVAGILLLFFGRKKKAADRLRALAPSATASRRRERRVWRAWPRRDRRRHFRARPIDHIFRAIDCRRTNHVRIQEDCHAHGGGGAARAR